MKTTENTTNRINREAALEKANTRRAQASYNLDRIRERGEDATEATAAHETALNDFAACERYFLGGEYPDTDTIERIRNAGHNVPEVEGNGLEAQLQRAQNAYKAAEWDGRDAETVDILKREYDILNRLFVRSMFS